MRMKSQLLVFITLIALTSMFQCKNKESKTKGSDKTIYSCTMHHQVREYSKGQCPICGMDLVIVPDINNW